MCDKKYTVLVESEIGEEAAWKPKKMIDLCVLKNIVIKECIRTERPI